MICELQNEFNYAHKISMNGMMTNLTSAHANLKGTGWKLRIEAHKDTYYSYVPPNLATVNNNAQIYC